MSLSWSSLITAPTAAEAFSTLIGLARSAGFPVTSWATKAVPRVILQLVAKATEQLGQLIVALAKSGFRTTAKGGWLDALAEGVYGIRRQDATFAIVSAKLANAGAAPLTIAAGDLFLLAGGLLYRNQTGGTLAAGGELPLEWQAEHPGTAYNLDGEALEGLATPLPGVSITAASGTGWLVTQGTDDETDEALAIRCGEQWSTLGASGSADAYAYNAKTASSEVTRVRVYEHTPTPGWVTMYLAGPAGPVSVATANDVRAWIEAQGRRPMCVGLVVSPAGEQTITVTGTVKVKAGRVAEVQASMAKAFAALQASTDFGALVDQAEVIATVRTIPGVVYLSLATPAADVALGANQLAVLVDGLTYVEV